MAGRRVDLTCSTADVAASNVATGSAPSAAA